MNLSTGLSPSRSPAGADTVAMETGCDHHPSGGLGPAGGREGGGVHRLGERTRGPERAGHTGAAVYGGGLWVVVGVAVVEMEMMNVVLVVYIRQNVVVVVVVVVCDGGDDECGGGCGDDECGGGDDECGGADDECGGGGGDEAECGGGCGSGVGSFVDGLSLQRLMLMTCLPI